MPRVEFSGEGVTIPEYAIPPFGGPSTIPPTILTFTEDATFPVQQYRDLGYTHFEVWCIGAAGGRGGGVQTGDQAANHYEVGLTIRSYSYGGEGGGGGLHKIGGLLTELDAVVPVIVGHEGVTGQDGNRHHRWLVASAWMNGAGGWANYAVLRGQANVPYMTDAAGNAIPPYFFEENTGPYLPSDYLYYPNPYYTEPQDGSEGGASAFALPLCLASGGTGGKRSLVYRNNNSDTDRMSIASEQAPGGEGGQGGVGGRWVAGGGGDGGKASDPEWFDTPGGPFPPGYSYRQEKPRILTGAKDGFWDGVIGQGGGGGRGGTLKNNGLRPVPGGYTEVPPTILPSTSGGKGSFSYADTSVYGSAGSVGTQALIPGTAGGARVLKTLKYGSRSPGYNPNGVVVVRLTRITD